jgi:hypothetical protein
MATLSLGKEPQYAMGRRLGGPQNQFGCDGEEKIPCLCQESNFGHPLCSLVTIPAHFAYMEYNSSEDFCVPSHILLLLEVMTYSLSPF